MSAQGRSSYCLACCQKKLRHVKFGWHISITLFLAACILPYNRHTRPASRKQLWNRKIHASKRVSRIISKDYREAIRSTRDFLLEENLLDFISFEFLGLYFPRTVFTSGYLHISLIWWLMKLSHCLELKFVGLGMHLSEQWAIYLVLKIFWLNYKLIRNLFYGCVKLITAVSIPVNYHSSAVIPSKCHY